MNSSKRGTVTGFKLVTLQRVRPHHHMPNNAYWILQLLDTHSTDKKQNLLHYLTHVVEKVYPNLLSFYEDLKIGRACDGTNNTHTHQVTFHVYSVTGDGEFGCGEPSARFQDIERRARI